MCSTLPLVGGAALGDLVLNKKRLNAPHTLLAVLKYDGVSRYSCIVGIAHRLDRSAGAQDIDSRIESIGKFDIMLR